MVFQSGWLLAHWRGHEPTQCVLDVVHNIANLDLVSDLLYNLWRQFSTSCDELATHALHVFSEELAVDVLRHQVRWVLGTRDLA